MPRDQNEIEMHQNEYASTKLETIHTSDYRKLLANEVFFWDDPHGFIMLTVSGERIVTNTEQLDALIEHLEGYRQLLPEPKKWLSEK